MRALRSRGFSIFLPLAMALAMVFVASGPAAAWRAEFAGPGSENDFAYAIALDDEGGAFVGGRLAATGPGFEPLLVKFAAASGVEIWRASGLGEGDVSGLATDASGDVVAVGSLDTGVGEVLALKLRGSDGQELWKRVVPVGEGYATLVAVDAQGDVIAAGFIDGGATLNDILVVKLRGTDGMEIWRRQIDSGGAARPDSAHGVAVDALGDVVVAGNLPVGSESRFGIVKLRGSDGMELWRSNDTEGVATSLAVGAGGTVFAAGFTPDDPFATDLAVVAISPTGSELWSRTLDGTEPGSTDLPAGIAVDAAGDVLVGGWLENEDTGPDFAAIKLSPAGVEIWRQVVEETMYGGGLVDTTFVEAFALDASGNAILGGSLDAGTDAPFTVMVLSGSTGDEICRSLNPGTLGPFAGGGASVVAADARGNIVAAGDTSNVGTAIDVLVVGLDSTCAMSQAIPSLPGWGVVWAAALLGGVGALALRHER